MKKLLPLFILFITIQLSSQDRIPVELQSTKIYLDIITPSVTLEAKVSNNQSVLFRSGIRLHAEENFDEIDAGLLPYGEFEFRNYYPRKRVKKELKANSGNYIGLIGGYNFGHIVGDPLFETFKYEKELYFAALWGIQRNYKSNIHLNLHLGPGIITHGSGVDGLLMINFHLGFGIGN